MKGIILFICGLIAGALLAVWLYPQKTVVDTYTEIVVKRDTIRIDRPIEKIKYLSRTDTVYLMLPGTVDSVAVEVPIERKEYAGQDYRLVIEGFRPELISMELFPRTTYVTKTNTVYVPKKRGRWGVGIQAGYGFTPNKATPYIGVGVQYNLISF